MISENINADHRTVREHLCIHDITEEYNSVNLLFLKKVYKITVLPKYSFYVSGENDTMMIPYYIIEHDEKINKINVLAMSNQ